MKRSALKEVLLDLKAQMRSKRASTYGKKKDEKPKTEPRPDSDVEDATPDVKVSEAKDVGAKKSDKSEDKVDFSEEIAAFMKGRRKSKSDGVSMVRFGGGEPSPSKPVKAEKKGK